jgi:hypothetical protein
MKKLALTVLAGCMSMAFAGANADQRSTHGVMHLAQAADQGAGTTGTASQPRNVQETQPAQSGTAQSRTDMERRDAVGQTGPGTAGGTGTGVGATADTGTPRTGAAATTTEREVTTTRERTEQRQRARAARQVKG